MSDRVEVRFFISREHAEQLRNEAAAFQGQSWDIEMIIWRFAWMGRRSQQRARWLRFLDSWPGYIAAGVILSLGLFWFAWTVWFPWLSW